MRIPEKYKSKQFLRIALPLSVLMIIGSALGLMIVNKPEVSSRSSKINKTRVFVIETKEEEKILRIFSQGQVQPLATIELRAEVAGKIVYVADNLVAGGGFNKGDILLTIDPEPYQLAVVQRQARVAQAQQQWLKAKAESEAAIQELTEMNRDGASDLAKGLPQLREAESALKSAQADLRLAELELSHTTIKAPFAGRVQAESVSVSQYIAKNVVAATIFSTDLVEIRLPLTLSQLSLIDLPLAYFSSTQESQFVAQVSMEIGADIVQWSGKIVRTEAAVDSRTRTIYAVARIQNPYKGNVPLLAGAFVNAEIYGTHKKVISALPTKALRNGQDLWLVDEKSQLRIQPANIVQRGKNLLFVADLPTGSKIVTSTLPIPTDGMSVEVVELDSNNNSQSAKTGDASAKADVANSTKKGQIQETPEKSNRKKERPTLKSQKKLNGGRYDK